jgi:hypothetical protein
MTAPDVPGLLAALARSSACPERARAYAVGLDAVRSARALRDGRPMPAPRRRSYSPGLAAYAARRRRNRLGQFTAALVALALLALAGCGSALTTSLDQARPVTPAPGVPQVIPYTDPISVTGVQRGSCLAGRGGTEPDPICTPGSVGTTDQDLVCAPRFQETKRPDGRTWTNPRTIAIVAYGIDEKDLSRVQYDHRIPLSLGGADDTSNLFPFVSDLPGSTTHNSKDAIEYSTWYAVCRAHTVTLDAAQRAFMGDWRVVLKVLKVRAVKPPAGVAGD